MYAHADHPEDEAIPGTQEQDDLWPGLFVVGWDQVAQVIGGPSQADLLRDKPVRCLQLRLSDRRPTATSACLSHPTMP
jgi:hypothetical protein